MNDYERTILLLKLYGLLKETIKSWGIFTEEVPVIITNSKSIVLISALANLEKRIMTSCTGLEKIRSSLIHDYSEFTFFVNDGGVKSEEIIRTLGLYAKVGLIDGEEFRGCPVIISSEIIDDEILDNAFYIFFDDIEHIEMPCQDIIPDMANLAVIGKRAESVCDVDGSFKDVLKAAACIAADRQTETDESVTLLNLVNELGEKSDQFKDRDGIARIFIRMLEEWIQKQEHILSWELDVVPEKIIEKSADVFFYDEKYVYFSNSKFTEIVQSIKGVFSTKALKEALAEDGILITGKGRSYLSKVTMYSQFGRVTRLDMLKFVHEKLYTPGEKELILAIKEKR